MRAATLGALCGLALLAACSRPDPARPALWEVRGPDGQSGWLFGTIHALDRPVAWRSAKLDAALSQADSVVVEVAAVADQAALAQAFGELSRTPGAGPLSARIAPNLRPRLAALYARTGLDDARFADMETWGAAIMLAQAQNPRADSANGIDRAVLAAAPGKPVIELEGARAQLGIFDRLPESEQRDLLGFVLADDATLGEDDANLAGAWRKGDMAAITRETRSGLLSDPQLRAALFTARNEAWTRRIAAMLKSRQHPFVAVGAAHMAGPEGLPAMLAAQGFRVSRIQ